MVAFPHSPWRLILSPPARGAWNMALDEAMLEASGRGEVAPTLRLYAWEPACLSLGYAQPVSDVSLSALVALGWDLVRRPTGGRAILHVDELTYSVCGPHSEPRLAGGVLESYRTLARALLVALRLLGIPAEALEQPPQTPSSMADQENNSPLVEENKNPVCFEVPSNYEITVAGKKLIGSAQARRKEGVLQHGSFPLFGDLTRIVQGLAFQDVHARLQAAERLSARATTAEQVLGEPLSWQRAAEAFVQAFRETLNLDLQLAQPNPLELSRAEQLVREKYSHPAWTMRI